MRSEAREAAYVEFVAARQDHLRRIAYAVCGDWNLAEDLLESALTRLYVAWPRLEREGLEETFVRRAILRGEASARRRRPDHGGSQAPAVIDALQRLPVKQRNAVLLRHWLGLSEREAAEDLGISAARLRSNAERGLAALEATLTREPR
jgi:DNA-directed RNA polymerase specialized sigma24 family protein